MIFKLLLSFQFSKLHIMLLPTNRYMVLINLPLPFFLKNKNTKF